MTKNTLIPAMSLSNACYELLIWSVSSRLQVHSLTLSVLLLSCLCLYNGERIVFCSHWEKKKRNRCVLLQMKPLYEMLWASQSIQLYRNYGIKNKHRSYLQVPELGLSVLSLQTRRTNLNAAWEIGEGRHTASSSFSPLELLNDSPWVDTGLSVWPEELDGWTVWNDKQKGQCLPVASWMETHCKTAALWAKA